MIQKKLESLEKDVWKNRMVNGIKSSRRSARTATHTKVWLGKRCCRLVKAGKEV